MITTSSVNTKTPPTKNTKAMQQFKIMVPSHPSASRNFFEGTEVLGSVESSGDEDKESSRDEDKEVDSLSNDSEGKARALRAEQDGGEAASGAEFGSFCISRS